MILSTFETIDWANKEDTKISFQWHFKNFFKRINTAGGSNYIWEVVPKCRCGYSETPIAKRA